MGTDLSVARRSTFGGLPYGLMGGYPQITYTEEKTTAVEKYVMRSGDVASFMLESFPLPVVLGGFILVPPRRRMPGTNFLVSKTIDAKPLGDALPGDPLGIDGGAPSGTYCGLYEVTVNYETDITGTGDSGGGFQGNNPETFLERSINIGGEFISWNPRKLETGAAPVGGGVAGTTKPVDTPDINFVKTVPTGEFNFRWKFVVAPPWATIFGYMGAVNSTAQPIFFNAEPETILFQGVSASQNFIWSGASARAQPWQLDYKFSLKRVFEGGKVFGWNHIWEPRDQEWQKIYRQGSGGAKLEAYARQELLNLFAAG